MVKITFLGTANAIPNQHHHNTQIIIEAENNSVLIDCGGNPISQLDRASVNPLSITDLIITHFHPDHVSGYPLLLLDLWLMGRKNPLDVYGLGDVISRVDEMMRLYQWQAWQDFYDVKYHRLDTTPMQTIIDNETIKILASPMQHIIPSIGLRISTPGGSLFYSSDTMPCENLRDLANGVDIMIHETTGKNFGHSSSEEAGKSAQEAGAKALYLVHYPITANKEDLIRGAKMFFSGEVVAAEDLMTFSL
jgi:ribonuclease Z